MSEYPRLFIPGPVEVSPTTLQAMVRPMIGHRSDEFVALYRELQPKLQALFATKDPVFVSTSSAWGVMEGAVRNFTKKAVLNCMCGAFSDKWHDVSRRQGKSAAKLQTGWGKAIDPEAMERELASGKYDAVTLVHNETSTGVMNPLSELMAVIATFPNVISIVDTVSSFSALPIEKDQLGIDVMLTGTQKALALPPGLALASVSQRALRRAAEVSDRGYYFDFLEFQKNHERGMTPSTPNIPLMFALNTKLAEIFTEGLEVRFARHRRLNKKVRRWAHSHGFTLFPAAAHASVSMSCFNNDLGVDFRELNKRLRERYHCVIDGGYGKLKERTFRISNMGDETDQTIDTLLTQLDDVLANMALPANVVPGAVDVS